MKLAWNEIKFYKFRYVLIMLIIVLLSLMVLFISGLAQGLARENVSMFDQFKSTHYITQDMKEPQIEKSHLSSKQQMKINKVINIKPTQMNIQSLEVAGNNDEDVLTMYSPQEQQFDLKEGQLPTKKNQIAVNQKLTGEGIKIGDDIQFKHHQQTYKVTGVLDDAMYAHSSIVLMNQKGFQDINRQYALFYPVNTLSQQEEKQINDIPGIKVTSTGELKANIASYQAEQAPLKMMVMSLFVITAIVLSAFFYVMTIQKVSEIGILKAIGIKTRHLLTSLLLQILIVTLLSVVISVGIIAGIAMILPVTMPFHLNTINYILVIGIFIIVAIVGALLSFIKVVKVDPIEAIGGGE